MIEYRPKVSVVVPVYNVEKYLDRCVNSLVSQTLKEIEIILVDDGSPDSSGRICDQWAERDFRVRVFHQENGGPSVARNHGIEVALGEYVAFVDSDDSMEPEAYATLYAEAKRGAYDVVYCGNMYHCADGTIEQNGVRDMSYRGNDVIKHIGDMLYEEGVGNPQHRVVTSACMGIFRRKIIEKYNLRFMLRYYSEDILFNIDFISNCSSVRYLPYAFYNYYYTEGSRSNIISESKIDANFRSHDAVVKKIKSCSLAKFEAQALLNWMDCALWITKEIILSDMPMSEKRRLCTRIYDYEGFDAVFANKEIAGKVRRRERLFMRIIHKKQFMLHYLSYVVYYRLLKGRIFA